jgi:Tol biopolymer transport system component/tRNA A-37 threonylcarbamoyl transferase component Bud32
MPLEKGAKLGVYEVAALIGVGGMGEVYRARDTRLRRDVALKLIPAALARDRERMIRFEREAQLLASLNHPGIATIYGLEDADGQRAIVMELVDGRELGGPLPPKDALRLAHQIAEALEFAHERGVVHRDLKPANIKVTPDGVIKILDFGLARALEHADRGAVQTGVSTSPTQVSDATVAGAVLGTAAYMAPEQARGNTVDRRADVWAFGVVLFELLTGRRVFGGDSLAETLASVMKDPIALDRLPSDTPGGIRRLLARCLDRDMRRRLQSMGEARIAIEDAIAGVGRSDQPGPTEKGGDHRAGRLAWAIASVAVLAAIAAVGWTWTRPAAAIPAVARFTIEPPDGTALTASPLGGPNMAVSPDGRYVAFVAEQVGVRRNIWVRAIDSLVAQRLDQTDGATYPFWSPDSQQLAYFANEKLMRVSVAGGAPLTICDAPDGEGGTWFETADGNEVIVFAPTQNGPLHRVLAKGGVSAPATTLTAGESAHMFPQVLPDGRVLYTARGAKPGVYVHALGSDARIMLLESQERVVYSPPDLLLYLKNNVLLAHRVNLDTLSLEGEPVSIADGVRSGIATGRSAFAVSPSGVLAYRQAFNSASRVRWYGRDGRAASVVLEADAYANLELSPDGKLLAVTSDADNDRDIWIKDLAGGSLTRLTSTPAQEGNQVWSPDSRRLAFVAGNALFDTVIGSGQITAVPGGENLYRLEQWTNDGYLLARTDQIASILPAPGGVSASGSRETPTTPRQLFKASYDTDQFRVSPDGKWVSFTSQESGRPEVIVAAFPSFTARRQISVDGGEQARWRADGKELFFHARDQRLLAAEVAPGDTLSLGPVKELFRTNPAVLNPTGYNYDVSADGQRFLLREPAGEAKTVERLYVVTNWTSLVGN